MQVLVAIDLWGWFFFFWGGGAVFRAGLWGFLWGGGGVCVWGVGGVSWGVVGGCGMVEVVLGNWLGQVGIEGGSCPGQALTRLSGCVSCGAGTGCWGRRTISLGRRWCVCCKRT